MIVVEHLEKFLGKIDRAIKINDAQFNISVSIFENCPFNGVKTFATLGLNRVLSENPYELIFVCDSKNIEEQIASFMVSFSEYISNNNLKLYRGTVIMFDFNLTTYTKMKSIYIAQPFYFDEDFQALEKNELSVIFPLLVPLYENEAKKIQLNGWKNFELFLEKNEINNLWDLNRNEYFW